jgi:ATP-binding cassette subfamily F protein uup
MIGGIEEYLERRRGRGAARPAQGTAGTSAAPVSAEPSAVGTGAPVDLRAARKELTRLERQIAKLDAREAELHDQLATHATDYEKVASLDAELRAVREERDAAEERWLQLSELLEA